MSSALLVSPDSAVPPVPGLSEGQIPGPPETGSRPAADQETRTVLEPAAAGCLFAQSLHGGRTEPVGDLLVHCLL